MKLELFRSKTNYFTIFHTLVEANQYDKPREEEVSRGFFEVFVPDAIICGTKKTTQKVEKFRPSPLCGSGCVCVSSSKSPNRAQCYGPTGCGPGYGPAGLGPGSGPGLGSAMISGYSSSHLSGYPPFSGYPPGYPLGYSSGYPSGYFSGYSSGCSSGVLSWNLTMLLKP